MACRSCRDAYIVQATAWRVDVPRVYTYGSASADESVFRAFCGARATHKAHEQSEPNATRHEACFALAGLTARKTRPPSAAG
ncbi:hypothetical protein C0Z16_28760 [Paraburkholderia rhynchosiae]|uniref:Uncharacterized protein n=1 Tax=Paraburkholderia rhynchosiae TaxID=487049 RepID=A0ABX4V0T6_9BURK|nr:hypothetical protein C0Z16_28760 [Paraburkholderia rhynchosiae]